MVRETILALVTAIKNTKKINAIIGVAYKKIYSYLVCNKKKYILH